MSTQLTDFVAHCTTGPVASAPVAAFIRAFRASLPAEERPKWTRTRIIAELSRQYQVGTIAGVAYLAGVGLPYVVRDGQLAVA